ncbi:hypothetical protein EGR_06832 [Echinococcus granulosus]|uniref:Uncharacterized protein n=1 Tax=Echinococcus granulosus TaxID=6210 RepID=W6UB34_ECHGR|nr:hypothetical protein EGR_06832 [Echinococcus granulosus]EUB58305.1 hypothetical protein EGR_06832 [Echinococcus granulosus]
MLFNLRALIGFEAFIRGGGGRLSTSTPLSMSLMTISSLLTATLCLGLLQVSSAYRHSTSQFRDRFIPIEEENLWPYWMDDPDIDGEEQMVSDRMNKKSHPTVPSLPQYLERLKKFQSLKDKEKYVAALNSYYMIFGRPREKPGKVIWVDSKSSFGERLEGWKIHGVLWEVTTRYNWKIKASH